MGPEYTDVLLRWLVPNIDDIKSSLRLLCEVYGWYAMLSHK